MTGRESHRKSAKYEKRKSWTRRARLTAPQPWTPGQAAAAPPAMFVTIIGNNANRPPPFYSQPEHFQGVTAHSTSKHTNQPAFLLYKPNHVSYFCLTPANKLTRLPRQAGKIVLPRKPTHTFKPSPHTNQLAFPNHATTEPTLTVW